MSAVLELRSVTKKFGGVVALNGLNLSIQPGEIVGLIGPNGAGKTTVINLITGLLRLDGGSVLLAGRDVSRAAPDEIARAGVGRTFQNIRLFKEMTVRDNVQLALQCGQPPRILANALGLRRAADAERATAAAAEAILAGLDLAGLANARADSLSYGHQRRLEIARAVALKPGVILLDEPVAGMNDAEAAQLAQVLMRLRDQGLALLLIEHNVPFVFSLCSRIYVLSYGTLIAEGSPSEIQRNPDVVEAYLGE